MKFSLPSFLLAALMASAAAQNEVPQVPPLPEGVEVPDVGAPPLPGGPEGPDGPVAPGRPVLEPVVPAVPVPLAPADPSVPILERQIKERLEYPKADGNMVAAIYRQLTGERVIVASSAVPVEVSFIQDPPLTHGEAVELLKKTALLEGLVFVPSGDGVVKLVLATAGMNPRQAALPVIINRNDLPEGDEVVTFVMTLDFIKPEELVNTFVKVIGQFGPYGSIAAVPNASAVVITENSALIRSLLDLKAQIDVPSSMVVKRMVKVNFADVETLAETLNQILNAQQTQQTSASVQRERAPEQPRGGGGENNGAPQIQGADGSSSSSAGESTPVQIVPEIRTNRIFVLGRPVDVKYVEELIAEFDIATDQRNFLRRRLAYLSVSDFLPVAQSALERTFGASASGQQGGGRTGGTRGGSNQGQAAPSQLNAGNTGAGSRNNTGGSRSGAGGAGGGAGGAGAGGVGGGSLGSPELSIAPEPIVVGRTLLVADNITNSIVVQGPPASVEAINELLDQLDVKADQVMISTVFGQLSLQDDLDYGVDLLASIGEGARRGVAAQNRNGTTGLPDPLGLTNPSLFPSAGGLNVYAQIAGDFSAYIQALQTTGRFNVISRPTIFTGNNQTGTISSGQRIAVPTNVFNGGNSGNGVTQSTNIEYRDVVLSMEVRPLVNSDKEITMSINLLNDEIVGSQLIDGNDIPTIGTRALSTTVTIPNNATVVLGGLITKSDRNSVSGIPILSSIPLLGKFFSTTSKATERSELLIFIQPKIVNSSGSLLDAQLDIDSRYEISDGVRVFSDGQGVLPVRPIGGKESVVEVHTTQVAPAPVPAVEVPERRPKTFFQRRR